jgi:hypothetical protein
MSLKGFHIVFVSVCTLLFTFLAVWSLLIVPEASLALAVLGGVGIVGALLMPVYGFCFYRKISKIHI